MIRSTVRNRTARTSRIHRIHRINRINRINRISRISRISRTSQVVRTASVLSLLTAVSGVVVLTHAGDSGPATQASASRTSGAAGALNAQLIRSDAAARSSRSATRTPLGASAATGWAEKALELRQARTLRADSIRRHRLLYLQVKAKRDAHAEQVEREREEAAKERARAATLREASRNAQRNPQAAARALLASRGWASQFGCLDSLWTRESNWNHQASNPSSGAYGIPQALPGRKMASAGADWRTNPMTQIEWGLGYIADRYGSPCAAWGHSESHGWY